MCVFLIVHQDTAAIYNNCSISLTAAEEKGCFLFLPQSNTYNFSKLSVSSFP